MGPSSPHPAPTVRGPGRTNNGTSSPWYGHPLRGARPIPQQSVGSDQPHPRAAWEPSRSHAPTCAAAGAARARAPRARAQAPRRGAALPLCCCGGGGGGEVQRPQAGCGWWPGSLLTGVSCRAGQRTFPGRTGNVPSMPRFVVPRDFLPPRQRAPGRQPPAGLGPRARRRERSRLPEALPRRERREVGP